MTDARERPGGADRRQRDSIRDTYLEHGASAAEAGHAAEDVVEKLHRDERPDAPTDGADGPLRWLTLPLRGLASEGADAVIQRSLAGLCGVAAIDVRIVEQVVRISYDDAQVTPEEIRIRLRDAAGMGRNTPPARE